MRLPPAFDRARRPALALIALLGAALHPASAQDRPVTPARRAWTVQGLAAHIEGNEYLRSPRGAAVRVQWPLGATPLFAGLGASHATDIHRAAGYACFSVDGAQCPSERLTLRGRMSMGELLLGARVSGAGRVEAEVHLAVLAGNITGIKRGDSTGIETSSSKGAAAARLGADVVWWRWQRARLGVRLSASAGGFGPVTTVTDAFEPFNGMYEHYELRIGVSVRGRGS